VDIEKKAKEHNRVKKKRKKTQTKITNNVRQGNEREQERRSGRVGIKLKGKRSARG